MKAALEKLCSNLGMISMHYNLGTDSTRLKPLILGNEKDPNTWARKTPEGILKVVLHHSLIQYRKYSIKVSNFPKNLNNGNLMQVNDLPLNVPFNEDSH